MHPMWRTNLKNVYTCEMVLQKFPSTKTKAQIVLAITPPISALAQNEYLTIKNMIGQRNQKTHARYRGNNNGSTSNSPPQFRQSPVDHGLQARCTTNVLIRYTFSSQMQSSNISYSQPTNPTNG
jgi:hypothetical protein